SDGGKGFDIAVATDRDLAGRAVALIVDGHAQVPLSADAVAGAGSFATAMFAAVPLGEGNHRVQAQCTDLAGNVTTSAAYDWLVDTTPCDVRIIDPPSGTELVPADDTDLGSGGVQVMARATLSGEGCSEFRAGTCDPSAGISGGTRRLDA